MPAYQPAQDNYHAVTYKRAVKARQTMEYWDESMGIGRRRRDLTEQQRKDYKALCKVTHVDESGEHPTSQELQNIYRRCGV